MERDMVRISLLAMALVALAACSEPAAGPPYQPLATGYGGTMENPIYHPGGMGLEGAPPSALRP
jgi:hypothetical protein